MQKTWINIDTEQSQRYDPDSVLDYGKRKDQDEEHGDFPSCRKIEVRRKQTGNEERNTGPDPAAFGRHLDRYGRDRKYETLAQYRHTKHLEKNVRHIC